MQPIPVFVPGESYGQKNLVGYSPKGSKEPDKTERFNMHAQTKIKMRTDLPSPRGSR